MIKNKKTTSKFMSVLSAVIAVIMLSTTVFASGVLSDMTTDDYTIQIANNDEKIELTNKPFIENGEVYVPLRELFEKAVPKDEGIIDVKWNDGTIDVVMAYYQGESGMYQFKIGGGFIKLQHISYEDYINNSIEKSIVVTSMSLKQAPILKNSLTYVTLKDINYMLYGYTNRRDGDNKLFELTSAVYDKNGDKLDDVAGIELISPSVVKISKYDNTTPEYTIDQFFYLFGDRDFENMKKYCTQNCINTFFKDDAVFGMKKANLTEMNIDPLEYAKSSNGFNVFVSVDMTPSEESVFDPRETSTSFYVILLRQADGRYLIDQFATGL